MPFEWDSWIGTVAAIALAVAIAAIAVIAIRVLISVIGRKVAWVGNLGRRVQNALSFTALVVALWIGSSVSWPGDEPWWPAVSRVFLIATIAAGAWLLSAAVSLGFEWMIAREEGSLGGAEGRRRTTQLLVIHRLILVVIGIVAVGVTLFSFPEMRAVGTSLLASAGIASIIAGLAAQSILGNVIAGIQVAFSDAIRVGDVVVIEGEWGRIGEINLSYVVVDIWDERRLVLPCSYFTTKPIETWTRRSDAILGTVYMDLDWRVPMEALREKFDEILDASPAWDRRSKSVYVTGSEGGYVTVRLVMSSKDSDDQWALRCEVREKLMTWLQQEHPEALPRTRVALEG